MRGRNDNDLYCLCLLVIGILLLLIGWQHQSPVTYHMMWTWNLNEKANEIQNDRLAIGCDVVRGNTCYNVHLRSEDLGYPEAAFFCENHDSIVAIVSDTEIYKALREIVRRKMDPAWQAISIWVNVNKTIENQPRFWYPDDIKRHDDIKNFYMVVDQDPASESQGLRHGFALSALKGVACQRTY